MNRIVIFLFSLLLFSKSYSSNFNSDSTQRVNFISIDISGNKITKAKIILRELVFKVGDSISSSQLVKAIAESKQNLTNTGLFHEVKIIDSIFGNQCFISITVIERWYIWAEPTFTLADRNFNEWWLHKDLYRTTYGITTDWNNFTGNKDRLKVSLILGWRQTLGLVYKIPYLNKSKTVGLQLTSNYNLGHEVPFITDSNRLKFLRVNSNYIYKQSTQEILFTYRKKHKLTHYFSLGYDYYNIGDTITKSRNPEYLNTQKATLNSLYLDYQLVYDNRDYFFYPEKGEYLSAEFQRNGLGLPFEDISLTTITLTAKKYFPLYKNFVLINSLQATHSLQATSPYIYKNSLGYRMLVRGYEHYVVNGQSYFLSNNELRYKLIDCDIKLPYLKMSQFNKVPMKVYVKLLGDVGYVNGKVMNNNSLINQWLIGYGVGLDVISYYDKIMRLEFSNNKMGEREVFLHYIVAF
ncbi:MAG: BamA/TamA family outer membrane protein [Bacteroidetes bacterium]|nr:BamA/TamA family outer membrane protein [Bacteroidota bacterium]